MADGNNAANQKNENQKPGLSWTQPAQNTGNQNQSQNKGANNNTPRPAAGTSATNTTAAADSTPRVIGIIIGIVVIFALAAWGIVALHNRSNGGNTAVNATSTPNGTSADTNATTNSAQTSSSTSAKAQSSVQPTTVGGASFTIPSPQAAGATVTVDNLSLSAPTWIIVYDDVNGNPGNILGATLLYPTDKSSLVYLLRATIPGTDYLASAAVDDGQKTFNLKNEKIVTDTSGSQMWIKFQTR